jgi:transposase
MIHQPVASERIMITVCPAILYDMTNTHFEGLCAKNPKARHGKNKQKRNDCRQVAVGMAFDEHGLALAHDVFEGNIAETKTLATMLDRLDLHKDTTQKPVVVLDAGFASAANIALLKERGYSYLINITRDRRRKYAEQFAQDGFEALPGRKPEMQVEVRRITDPEDAQSRLILCRSAQRRAKETAMLSKAETRFLSDFEALRKLIAGGKLKKPDLIERRIGRLEKKHPRAARYYTLRHATAEGLTAQRDDDKHGQASEALGNYVLKTDHTLDAEQTWSLYMTLLQAEEGFCALKSTLGMRPNYHQLEGRVDGHIFISVLAYHLLTWVREKLENPPAAALHPHAGDHVPDAGRRAGSPFAQADRSRCRASDGLPAARHRLESSLPRAEDLGERRVIL